MGKNTLVINCDIGETRVALIENGILSELHVERRGQKGIVGNIYLGKVSRVLPGMQAAFIDIGEERAAFLHVEDLIKPADFDAYLAGSKQREHERGRPRSGTQAAADDAADAADADEADLIGHAPSGEHDHAHESHEEHGDIEVDVEMDLEDGDDTHVTASESEELQFSSEIHVADDESYAGGEQPRSTRPLPMENAGPNLRSTLDELAPKPVDEPDSPVLREPRPLEDGAVIVRKRVPPDGADMAARRGRRRRGGRAGEKRDDLELETKAEEGDVIEGATAAPGTEGEISSPPPAPAIAAAPTAPSAPITDVVLDEGGEIIARITMTDVDAPPGPRPARTSPLPRNNGERAPRTQGGGDRGAARGRGRDGRSGNGGGGGNADRSRGRDGRPGGGGGGGGSSGGADRGRTNSSSSNRSSEPREGGLRLGRSTPINEVVKEGQEVVVQVTKDPISSKGARVSSHISLPGRYVVYMPTVEHVGVSRRIGSDNERRRLREAIEAMKPPQGGLIVRTLAEGLTKKQLKADVGYLVRLWGEIAKKKEESAAAPKSRGRSGPTLLSQELDVVLRTARDMFTDDIEKIVIDDKDQYQRLKNFVEMFMPERVGAIELYTGDEPIFDAYGLEDEIARALSRKVPLPSGGYLIIDQAEALTAIDVNSGRFVGKGNKDPEDTILQTNLEAVQEIAYQLRFRNIGGLIVLDLIDMERHSNREKVYRALEQALLADKAKTSINRISELGLVEMTRKRTRESLGRTLHEPCFYCDGTGQLQSRQTVAFEILRQIRRERSTLSGYKVLVNAHPTVIDFLHAEARDVLKEAERRYQRQIMLVPHREYHLEQFDLGGS